MRSRLDSLLRDALRSLEESEGWPGLAETDPELERSRDSRHGDFTSNVAMRVAKSYGRTLRDFAEALTGRLAASELIESAEVAGPGFVNLRLSAQAIEQELRRVLEEGESYGSSDRAGGLRILVEYVSTNPTGPPARRAWAQRGLRRVAAAKLLRATGHAVDEEYYVNDAGRQIDILAASVWLRYVEALGSVLPFPANAYQGGYVREIAARLVERHGDALVGDVAAVAADLATGGSDDDDDQRMDRLIASIKRSAGERAFEIVLNAALDEVLADIRDDLEGFSRPLRALVFGATKTSSHSHNGIRDRPSSRSV